MNNIMNQPKYAVILGNLGNTRDRFLSSGYKDNPDKETMLKQAASIEEVSGIELVGTWDIDERNITEMKGSLKNNGLKCASIIPDLFSQKRWGKGTFSSTDPSVRRSAVAEIKKMTDVAVTLDCSLLNIWPGQDGYDYPLCADYLGQRKWFLEGLSECAEYAEKKKVRLALEYKLKEPRTHSYLARVSDTLMVVQELNRPNVGVCIDTGHAFLAYENVGESIVLLKMAGDKLFHMHFNDNYGHWDDDMIVGSIHLVEYFEMLFWLEKTGYQGWYSMDQYPYREDGCGAIRNSVLFLQKLRQILERVGMDTVEKLLESNDPVETAKFVRDFLVAS